MSRRTKPLTDEDRVLWRTVADSVEPLRKAKPRAARPRSVERPAKAASPTTAEAAEDALPRGAPVQSTPVQAVPAAARPPLRPGPPKLDKPTHGKLAKGRATLDGRVDLHGMFQDEAHTLLLSFLRQAHARGSRHVLVITGKGTSSGGDGVLRRMVPAWFATTPFRELVSGFDEAARGHGGGGALYVRLKRRG